MSLNNLKTLVSPLVFLVGQLPKRVPSPKKKGTSKEFAKSVGPFCTSAALRLLKGIPRAPTLDNAPHVVPRGAVPSDFLRQDGEHGQKPGPAVGPVPPPGFSFSGGKSP